MKAILLDGSHKDDTTGERTRAALAVELQRRGWDVEHILLRECKIGNCAGDFYCWVRSPGMCNVDDDNRKIAAAIANSDLMVYLTPVTFGGYSSALKRMVDHQIQNILPFFTRVDGEIHHQKRYKKYPDFLAIGWMEAPDPQAEAVFRHLAGRNTRNFYAKTSITSLIYENQSDGEIRHTLRALLDDVMNGRSSRPGSLPEIAATRSEASPIQRALLLVGSPRTRKSTSQSLGGYLLEQLEAQGIQTETRFIHTSMRSPERVQALLEAVDAADLVALAFPLYVDTLPAPVIEALERIAAHRASITLERRQRFAAIANCGFPEAQHNANALAVCALFAQQAGFDWAGGLALGGGQGLVQGISLAELDGRAVPIRKALEMAAQALVVGESIPSSAEDLLAKPVIPPWLYQIFASYGWRQQARRYGAQNQLRRQTYLVEENQKS